MINLSGRMRTAFFGETSDSGYFADNALLAASFLAPQYAALPAEFQRTEFVQVSASASSSGVAFDGGLQDAIHIGTDFNVSGYRWTHDVITWSFATGNYPDQGERFDQSFAPGSNEANFITQAFNLWDNAATNLTFRQVADGADVDIRIGWGLNLPNQGSSNTLGITYSHASGTHTLTAFNDIYYTFTQALIMIDWADDFSDLPGGTSANKPFLNVVLHEIGHALGLDHYDIASAIMNTNASNLTSLTSHETNGVNYLYSTPGGSGGGGGGGSSTTDYTIALTNISQSSGSAGQRVNVDFRITNIGLSTGAAPEYKIYLSQDQNIDINSDRLVGNGQILVSIAGGNSITAVMPFDVPAGLTGTWYVAMVVDPGNYIAEANNNNNTSNVFAFNITGGSGGGGGGGTAPDLVADTVSLGSNSVIAGGSTTVSYHLYNAGNATAAASTSRIYLSTDSTITTSDTVLQTVVFTNTVSPSSWIPDTQTVTLPGNLASGTYYIGVIADHDNHVTESNESNNASAGIAVTVTGNRAPQISLPSGANVTAASAGQTFQMSALFTGSDPDNNPLTYYLYDSSAAANSGHWVVNGTIVAAQTIYQITAAQVAQTTFVAGAVGAADDILVQVYDGQIYSGWNSQVHVTVNAPPMVSRPSGATVTASTAGQSFAFSSLFAGSDPNGDALTYYLYDSNAAANSGHWVVNGATVAAATIYQVTASQLAQTSFVVGAAGTSDDLAVQVYDGRAYSGWNTQVHVNAPVVPNIAPTVSRPSGATVTASTAGQSFAFSSLFAGSDANGDPLTYFLYDSNAAANSGHWVVNGTTVAAGTIYQVSASQLAQTSFVTGAAGTSDDLAVQVYDGQAYSGWNTQVHVNAPAVNIAPTVSRPGGATVTASTAGQSFAFSSLFAGNDANGDPLTYYLYDSNAAANSGHWVVNGTTIAATTIYQMTASQLAQTSFVVGAAGTSDDILVQVYDGQAYSGWNTQVHVNAPTVPNIAPTVSRPGGANVTASTAGQSFAFASLFAGSDANSDPLTYYLYDSTTAANSGHWVVNGTTIAAQTIYQVSASQLAQTSFVAGAVGTADDILVQVYDGQVYSGWNTQVHLSVNTPPTVSRPAGATVTASTAGQSFAFSSLFAGSDANGDALTYYLYDSNTAANSGHWVVNGTTVAAGVIYQVSAAQLAQTSFVAGDANTADDILVQAYDGRAYSGWNTQVHVNGPANTAPTVSLPSGTSVTTSSPGRSYAFSSLFAGNDANGDPLTYYLYDSNGAANSGHWVVNGNTVAAQTIYPVTAAQLAQTSFVAGASGTADDILVQTYDGRAYSGWNAQVHVAVANNVAPTVSLPSGTAVHASAGQSLAASGLFSGSDLNGDTLSYYVYDSNAAGNSGHFAINGTTVAAGVTTLVTAAQLAQTTFVAGTAGTTDYIYVEAFDGQAYSPWTEFHVFV